MNTYAWHRYCVASVLLSLWLVGLFCTSAAAIPAFNSIDIRLPNPDRPYEMTSGTAFYQAPPYFALYDLEFQPSNPSQLDIPSRRDDGR